nr:MAG TPA: hypothetical protein [Caudoviricetes sp.]
MLYYYSYVTDTEEMPLGVSSTDLDMVRSWAKKTVERLEETAAWYRVTVRAVDDPSLDGAALARLLEAETNPLKIPAHTIETWAC